MHWPDYFIYRFLSILSATMSGAVVLTGISFPSLMMLSPKRVFSHILFFISFFDMIGSIGNSFGYPSKGTDICAAQNALIFFALPGSWIWTTFLVFQLRSVMIYNRVWFGVEMMHLVVIIVCLFLLLCPLATNQYGQDDTSSGLVVCNLSGEISTKHIWISVWFVVLLVCFLIMIGCIIDVVRHYRSSGQRMSQNVEELYNVTRLYPVGLVVTWFPIMIQFFLSLCSIYTAPNTVEILYFLQTQYGTILAFVYFGFSADARKKWLLLFGCRYGTLENQSDSLTVSLRPESLSINNLNQEEWGSGSNLGISEAFSRTLGDVGNAILNRPTSMGTSSSALFTYRPNRPLDSTSPWGVELGNTVGVTPPPGLAVNESI